MGLTQSSQIKSAVSSDGLHNVKKFAFIQFSIQSLQAESINIKKDWEDFLEQKFSQKIAQIQQQQQKCHQLLNKKVSQIELQDPDFIDKIQAKMKKSFKDLTGYKKAKQKLQIQKNKTRKNQNEQLRRIQQEIATQTEKVKQKLLRETPETPAIKKLKPELKSKVLAQYTEDDSYEIQRDQYTRRVIEELQKGISSQSAFQERFLKNNPSQEIQETVNNFTQNLQKISSKSYGCGFGF